MTDRVAEFLEQATAGPVSLRVIQLLGIWDCRVRSYDTVGRIMRDLSAAGLTCQPDLQQGGTGDLVLVGPRERVAPGEPGSHRPAAAGVTADQQLQLPPAALLVKHIPSAGCRVERVSPDQTLAQAQALMSAHEYSQLAIMSGDHDLKGAVSWQTIAKARLAKQDIGLRDATMQPAPEVHADDELLSQMDPIYRHGFVFVRDRDDRICGIVTTADLTYQFRDLTTPFFQLGEIERRLRRCIDRAFTAPDLQAATGKNKVQSADDMTFWEYIQLLDNEARWLQMGWSVDRGMFLGYLDHARLVRNKVMHFGEDLTREEKDKLVRCLNFMRSLDPLP